VVAVVSRRSIQSVERGSACCTSSVLPLPMEIGWHIRHGARPLTSGFQPLASTARGATLYLRSLELSEFRAFRTATLEFPRAGVVAVAGANNTGKSALLSALDVVRGDYGVAGSLTQHAAASSPARIRARFELAAEERERLLEQVEDRHIRRSRPLPWLEWVFVQIQEGALQATELHGAWDGGSIPLIQAGPQDPSGMTVSVGRAARILEGRSAEGLEAQETVAVGGSLPSIEGVLGEYAPGLVPAAEFLQAWRARLLPA
jgi:hypothetical protein